MFFNLRTGRILTENKRGDCLHCADGNVHIWGSFAYSFNPNQEEYYAFIDLLIKAAKQKHDDPNINISSGQYNYSADGFEEGCCNISISCNGSFVTITLKQKYLKDLAAFLEHYQHEFGNL